MRFYLNKMRPKQKSRKSIGGLKKNSDNQRSRGSASETHQSVLISLLRSGQSETSNSQEPELVSTETELGGACEQTDSLPTHNTTSSGAGPSRAPPVVPTCTAGRMVWAFCPLHTPISQTPQGPIPTPLLYRPVKSIYYYYYYW